MESDPILAMDGGAKIRYRYRRKSSVIACLLAHHSPLNTIVEPVLKQRVLATRQLRTSLVALPSVLSSGEESENENRKMSVVAKINI